MLKAAAARGVNLVTYREVLDQAIGIDGLIGYRDMYEYWRGVDSVIDGVDELLRSGHAAAVVELSEYALHCLEGAMDNAIDDGEMGMLQNRLEELHLKACRKAKPDPEALAERLFDWELTGDWGTFWDTGNTYGRVLGKNGIRRYRELAEAELPDKTCTTTRSPGAGSRLEVHCLAWRIQGSSGPIWTSRASGPSHVLSSGDSIGAKA